MTDDATRRRLALAKELRRARQAAGCTQARAAEYLGCKQAKIAKIESGATGVRPHDLERLLELYRPSETAGKRIKLLATARTAGSVPSSTSIKEYVDYRERERRATEVLALHGERIPVPLQSEHYRYVLHQMAGDQTDQTTLRQERDYRAEIFTAPTMNTLYRVVLSEAAFRRLPGGGTPDLLYDQAEHLLEMMDRHERLDLHVLLFEAKLAYLNTDYTVLRFNGADTDVVYVDSSMDGRFITAASRVRARVDDWHRVWEFAESHAGTRKFLRQQMDQAAKEMAHGNE